MPSHSEIERRKLLRKEAENSARAKEESCMPISISQLSELFDHLDVALAEGCDHTLTFTVAYLRLHGLSEALIIPWLQKYGGCTSTTRAYFRWF